MNSHIPSKELHSFAANIVDTVREPLLILDGHLRVKMASRNFYRLFQVKEDETEGISIFSLGNRQWDIPQLRKLLEQIIPMNNSIEAFEVDHKFLNNGRKTMLLNARKLFTPGNNSLTILLAIEDITERKQFIVDLKHAMESAESANRAKTSFLANMSHEIRTPMNAILGMGELLAETSLDDDQKLYVQTINRAGEGLLALVNDILDLSKIEAGELELENIPFDPRELARNSVEVVKIPALNKGTGIITDIDVSVPDHVNGDPQRLLQILLNLLSNAVKFTERGRVVLSVVLARERWLRFSVSDTGIGLPENAQETIFKPFLQAGTSTSRKFGGTGLGLSICQKLVKQMEGNIWVVSQPDQGSTFHVEIPFLQPSILHEKQKDALSTNPATTGKTGMSILLADDSEDNRLLIKAYLKKTPFRVTTVEDGLQALDRFKQGGFDLVLMDVQMPEMDGYEATKGIRAWEKSQLLPPTPVLALTASAMKYDINKTREAGCNLHLSKPIRKKILIDALEMFAWSSSPSPS
ncbi:MAG: response regulator [Magnetococcales bacterium]|nr:response regulator [Magnetococcales bacterium]